MKKKTPAGRPARGKLQSMRVSAGFRAFVLDQLSGLGGLRAQDMFGGVGLYADEVFFGILAADRLHFKVDAVTRGEYEAAGSEAFRPYPDRAMTMPYYQVPIAVLESPSTLVRWAERAVASAIASKTPKTSQRANRKSQIANLKSEA